MRLSDPKYKADDGTIINTVGTKTKPWYGSDGARTGYFCSKKWRDPNLTGNYGPSAIFGDQNRDITALCRGIIITC